MSDDLRHDPRPTTSCAWPTAGGQYAAAVAARLADTLVPPHWADLLVAGIPGATLTTYEDERHLIGVSRRVEIARVLTA